MRRFLRTLGSPIATALAVLALLAGLPAALAIAEVCTSTGVPSVVTDREDYAPGDTVFMAGQGLPCGATLTIKVTRPDGSVVKGDGSFSPGSDSVTTDSAGTFAYSYQLNGITGTYLVEVVDAAGAVLATTTFIDTHFRFGHLNWRRIGNTNVVEFESVQGWRRSAFGVTFVGQTVYLNGYSTGGTPSSAGFYHTVTFIDTANDWFLAKSVFQVTYPGTGPFTVSAASCCRISLPRHINNPDGSWRVAAIVNLNNGNTASPKTSLPVIVDCPRNATCSFAVVAADPDVSPGGQSLRWRLATAAEMGGGVQPGPPKAPNAATINSTTGVYSWNTAGATLSTGTGANAETLYSTQVIIEDRAADGSFISHSPIDFFIRLALQTNNAAPQFIAPSPPSGHVFSVPAGQPLSFTVNASDADPLDLVTLSVLGLPSGASFPLPAAANPAQSTFTWTPTAAQIGSHTMTFTASDGKTSTIHSIGILVGALGISKSSQHVSGPNPPEVGATSFFDVFIDLSVPAASPSPVTGISVNDPLPAGVTSQGGLSATQGSISYDGPAHAIRWNAGDLAGGQSAQGRFRVSVSPAQGDLGNALPLNTAATASGTFGGLPLTANSNAVSTAPVVAPSNRPPNPNAGGPYSVPEGSSVGLTGSGTDPDSGQILTYAWDLDNNGSFETPGQNVTFSAATLDGPSSATVALNVCDSGSPSLCATANATVNVTNVAPTVTLDGPAGVDEGQVATYTYMVTEPGPDAVSFAPGFPNCGAGGTFNGPAPVLVGRPSGSFQCRFPDGPATSVVEIRLVDDDGALGNTATVAVVVNNVAPTVALSGPASVNEGQDGPYTVTISDPGQDTFTFVPGLAACSNAVVAINGTTFNCFFPDDNPSGTPSDVTTLLAQVADSDGAQSNIASLDVTVRNVAPVVNAGADATITEGGTFSRTGASFFDVFADSFTGTVDFGDGAGAQPLTLSGNHTFSLSHRYDEPGTYTASVAVCDDDQGCGNDTVQVTVTAVTPPPFSFNTPLPADDACICLPNYMVADPDITHFWWARASGTADLEITAFAQTVNPGNETGSLTFLVYNPAGSLVATRVVNYPITTETPTSPVVIPGATPGSLYKIKVRASPPQPGTHPGTHYRLKLQGASLLGTNSPQQAQEESAGAGRRHLWAVYVNPGEDLDVVLQPGPLAPATTGTLEARDPNLNVVASAPLGTPLHVGGATPGVWNLFVSDTDHHTILNKTSGADRGLYVQWNSFGRASLSGTITRAGQPNTTPVTVEVIRNVPDGEVVRTVTGVTSSYFISDLGVGGYRIRVVTPPNLVAPAEATRRLTCDGQFRANFDIPNRPPAANAGPDQSLNEGATVSLNGSAGDPDNDSPVALRWSVASFTGPAITLSATDAPNPTFATTDNGTYTLQLTATDPFGASASDQVVVTVNNVAPTATFTAQSPVNEGSPFVLSLTSPADSSSADTAAAFTYAFDCGSGSGYGPSGASSTTSCPTTDNGSRAAKGKVIDKDGGATEYAASVRIDNVNPTLTITTPPEASLYAVNTAVNLSATFGDVGTADTHTCQVNWDDGTTSAGAVAEANGSGTCTASRSFAQAGVYTIGVTVADDDDGRASATVMVVVYDATAGFVTGGGWINSPAGAYTANPALSGKATFGFVSRYQRGASVPTGQTEFQFHAAGFNFHSSDYQWLVVAGAKAQYKGTGTVNGTGGYGFLLTATDGQVTGGGGADKFRIKIWNAGGVVYDNVVGASEDMDAANPQAIAGGSIVIHH